MKQVKMNPVINELTENKPVAEESTADNQITVKPAIIFQKITRISLYLLVFLIPLWFLPVTQEILNFQKQALLVILVLAAFVAWLAKTVREGELNIRMTWIHILVLAVLFTTSISTFFSLWRYGSFWGWPLNAPDSFLTILFLALLYFLI